ncbi:unnamed protein product [Ectocarpus fasciculatus]
MAVCFVCCREASPLPSPANLDKHSVHNHPHVALKGSKNQPPTIPSTNLNNYDAQGQDKSSNTQKQNRPHRQTTYTIPTRQTVQKSKNILNQFHAGPVWTPREIAGFVGHQHSTSQLPKTRNQNAIAVLTHARLGTRQDGERQNLLRLVYYPRHQPNRPLRGLSGSRSPSPAIPTRVLHPAGTRHRTVSPPI